MSPRCPWTRAVAAVDVAVDVEESLKAAPAEALCEGDAGTAALERRQMGAPRKIQNVA